MDQKLLDALTNLGTYLEEISNILQEKKSTSATGAALESGDISKNLKGISDGIKSIKKDTQEILKNQKTILATAQSKKKTPMEEIGGDEKAGEKIKKGLSTILLIAVAVLAIGLAFKIVGNVDFFSVIALGMAIVLISIAFKKVADLDITIDKAKVAAFTMVLMAMAITVSSWVMRMISHISLQQASTAILIGAMFTVLAFGMEKIVKAVGDIKNPAKVFLLPLLLPAMAFGIAISSWALKLVTPISFAQAVTAILIGAMFTVLAFGLEKIMKSIEGVKNPAKILLLPLILPIMAFSIAASSWFLQTITPVTWHQALTAILISAMFVVLSFGMEKIVGSISSMKWTDVGKLPVFFTLISLSIALSSVIFAGAQEYLQKIKYETMFKILAFSVCLSIAVIAVAAAMYVINKVGGPEEYLQGGVSLLIAAAAIAASSWILALGKYEGYPDYKWSLEVGLSLLVFGTAIIGFGFLMTASGGLGYVALLTGAVAVLGVATTIVAASYILGVGKYGSFPSLAWSTSVALSLMAFGTGAILLGSFITATFGIGAIAISAGLGAVLMVAQSIVDASFILSKGKYSGGPTKEWADGISSAMGAFLPLYGMLMKNKILSIFGGGVGPDDFTKAIITVSEGIVTAAKYFNGVKVAFASPIPKAWAEGVGMAIGAFSPVYSVLAENSGWFSKGPSVEDMKKAIKTISEGIVESAKFFADNKVSFTEGNYPSENWSKGVGAALGAFAPVFTALSKDTGWFTSGEDVIDNMVDGISRISTAIVDVAIKFSLARGAFGFQVNPDFIKNLSSNIIGYADLAKSISEKDTTSLLGGMFKKDPISNIASGMVKLANAYEKLAKSLKNFSNSLDGINQEKMNSFRSLTGNIALLSAMDSNMFGSMMDILETKSNVFANLLKSEYKYSNVGETTKKIDIISDNKSTKDSKSGAELQRLDRIISLLSIISKEVGGLDTYLVSKGNTNNDVQPS